ncbi:MAG: hypothetical protein IJA47_03390 [Oscillospiraceae bacterium]|nr:hypothetical protein [Oscillospiraceae bacterium]
MSLILTVPTYADSTVETRESAFFAAYGTDLYKASSTSFEVWFDVDSNVAKMDVIGVSEIVIYRSQDQETWRKMRTFKMEDYPEMIDTYAYTHVGYVTYGYASPGYYYTALVTFYAENSTGVGVRQIYTEIIRM